MAQRRHDNPTAATLEEIEHLGDRVVGWVGRNPRPVLAALAAILLVAGTWGGVAQYRRSRAAQATTALEDTRSAYLAAMGAAPTAGEVPEPANPETARRIRAEFARRFGGVAADHGGTPAAPLALLEAGRLQLELGEREAALAAWRQAAVTAEPALRAFLWVRIAQAEEDAGRWAEAAEGHARAGDTAAYPLRYAALGDAARCWAEAGEREKAVALYKRIRAESPQTRLPEHLAARLRELEASLQ